MSKNSTNIAEELNKTSEPVIMTTPLNFIAAAGSTYLIHLSQNYMIPVFKTQLAEKPIMWALNKACI